MKILTFNRPNDLSLLHDELIAAIPGLEPQPVPGEFSPDGSPVLAPVMTVEGLGNDISVGVPDNVDEPAVAAVVAAHDETTPRPDPRASRGNRIAGLLQTSRSNWTTAQLREIVELTAREVTG